MGKTDIQKLDYERALHLVNRMIDYADWMKKEGKYLEKNCKEIKEELQCQNSKKINKE